jgi:hypothetical protein
MGNRTTTAAGNLLDSTKLDGGTPLADGDVVTLHHDMTLTEGQTLPVAGVYQGENHKLRVSGYVKWPNCLTCEASADATGEVFVEIGQNSRLRAAACAFIGGVGGAGVGYDGLDGTPGGEGNVCIQCTTDSSILIASRGVGGAGGTGSAGNIDAEDNPLNGMPGGNGGMGCYEYQGKIYVENDPTDGAAGAAGADSGGTGGAGGEGGGGATGYEPWDGTHCADFSFASDTRAGVEYGWDGIAHQFTGTMEVESGGIEPEDVVDPQWVVTGHDNYTGGTGGTYPTTAASKAEQLATDQAAVAAKTGDIRDGVTVLGQEGTGQDIGGWNPTSIPVITSAVRNLTFYQGESSSTITGLAKRFVDTYGAWPDLSPAGHAAGADATLTIWDRATDAIVLELGYTLTSEPGETQEIVFEPTHAQTLELTPGATKYGANLVLTFPNGEFRPEWSGGVIVIDTNFDDSAK